MYWLIRRQYSIHVTNQRPVFTCEVMTRWALVSQEQWGHCDIVMGLLKQYLEISIQVTWPVLANQRPVFYTWTLYMCSDSTSVNLALMLFRSLSFTSITFWQEPTLASSSPPFLESRIYDWCRRRKTDIFGSVRSLGCHSICLCVCPSGTGLSKALNLHLSLIGQSQVSLRSLFAYFIRQTEPKILRLVNN